MSQPTPISASVSMVLPLSEVIDWPSGGPLLLKYSSYSSIQVQDAFIFDPQLQFIRCRLTAEEKRVVKRGRNRVVRLYQLLDLHSVCLSLFLSRLMLPSQIGSHDGTLDRSLFLSFLSYVQLGFAFRNHLSFLIDCRKKYLAWKLIWAHFFPLSP
ncbi:uncharacterized protein RHIMIDRAFT_264430, partial [Rhizopus microsporus ATCC 52813]